MPAVEMYTIIIITVMTMSQGLLQACFHFCKLSPEHSPTRRLDCNCSAYKQRDTRSTVNTHPFDTSSISKDSGIYYEPAPMNSPLAPSFVQPLFHTSRHEPNQNPLINGNILRKSYDTMDSLAEDISPQSPLTTTYKYKRGNNNNNDNYFDLEEIENPLHLYFDLDLKPESYSNAQLEQLKNMFMKFQEAEKKLSECINFHIYIFSKYKDNVNNTNWGQVEHDNLSRSQELTEIQNKCDQSESIIRQSIFEVEQSYPQKQNSSEIIPEDGNIVESTTGPDHLSTKVITKTNNNYNYITTTKTVEQDPIEHNDRNSPNIDSWHPTTLPVVNNAFQMNAKEKDLSKTSSSVNTIEENIPRRTLILEEELEITKIITKELSNGSVISVADGYEDLPNSDFMTNNVIPEISDESTEASFRTDRHNDLVEIKGNLYFLFGNEPIPARFMQQPGGEINIALDGFSWCTQMLQTNQSTFMNLLCNCIQQKKCTYT